jgi:ABC-type glutathione transport system ATPase component
MSGAPERDAVKATKEDSIIAEATRTLRADTQRTFDGEAPLQTIKCTIQFGGLVAVNALDMSVRRGEIYGLIGPNGAGKTTVFNLLTGVYKPTSGEIYFQGKRIDGLRSYEISRRGVSRTFRHQHHELQSARVCYQFRPCRHGRSFVRTLHVVSEHQRLPVYPVI